MPQSDSVGRLLGTLRREGLSSGEPVELSSGAVSCDFVDVKLALASGAELDNAATVVRDALEDQGVSFDAVGGLTLGADAIAAAVAMRTGAGWFVVRKERKSHGTGRIIEGARIDKRSRVVVVDDVVTTGGSIMAAYEAVTGCGAQVTAALTLVDRGDHARERFEALSVPYLAMVTYSDLGIKPV